MKKLLKITSLMLALVFILSALFSCAAKNNVEDDSENSSDSDYSSDNGGLDLDVPDDYVDATGDDTPTADLSKFPSNVFPIFANSEYALRVVTSDSAPSFERDVATKLRSVIKDKTGKSLVASTDYLKTDEAYDPTMYEILVGETAHAESESVYNATAYDSYGIKIIGRKMIFYFSTAKQGAELVSTFKSAIKDEKGTMFWTSNTLSTSKVSSININEIPKYPSTKISTSDCADNTKMVRATSTDLNTFNEYCKSLESAGYKEYSKRENVDGNYFRIYTKGDVAVNAYFCTGRKEARIIVGPIKDIPSNDVDPTPESFTPKLMFVAQSESVAGGLAMIYLLPNGKFLVIDGGGYLSDKLYQRMRELNPKASKITIAGWFLSHPHNDHQDSLENFIEAHAHDVDIEAIYFNYTTAAYFDLPNPDSDHIGSGEGHSVTRLRELIEKKLSRSTKIVKPHTGQIYTFGKSANVEIIWTVEDYMPTDLNDVNTASMVIRVTVAGTSTMILGDATQNSKAIILQMYNSHLKSDIVTLSHHGVWVFKPELYKRINAQVLLWPNNTKQAKEFWNKSSSSEGRRTIKAAVDCAKDVYLAKGTDNTFTLPYKIVNNKSEFVKYMNS